MNMQEESDDREDSNIVRKPHVPLKSPAQPPMGAESRGGNRREAGRDLSVALRRT